MSFWFNQKRKITKIPSSRIRTSDLRISIYLLQSSALPTELSKELVIGKEQIVSNKITIKYIFTSINLYEIQATIRQLAWLSKESIK